MLFPLEFSRQWKFAGVGELSSFQLDTGCTRVGFLPDDKKGAANAVVSHSSPKTGLEWGTRRLLPVQEAGSLLSHPRFDGR
jgi:hypothetical protein